MNSKYSGLSSQQSKIKERSCGFNLDFAPVSDIADENAKEKSIFYGTDAAKVGPIATGVVQGLQETGVSA